EDSPWRAFIAEPRLRHGGSLEYFITPSLWFGEQERAGVRTGLRGYVPLVEYGEYLSMSAAVAYQRVGGEDAIAFEGGLYVLFGMMGVRFSYALGARRPFVASFNLRFF
ncbi:MAG: hypothetical protein AAF411_15935, partial [Myxococcota bacterium]